MPEVSKLVEANGELGDMALNCVALRALHSRVAEFSLTLSLQLTMLSATMAMDLARTKGHDPAKLHDLCLAIEAAAARDNAHRETLACADPGGMVH
jgi:hypothetical protein